MTVWRYAATTDVGLVREVNEDAVYADDTLAVVADGMGGHAAGEVASSIAVGELIRGFGRDASRAGLLQAVRSANAAILSDAADHPEREGMGTTVVALALVTTGGGPLPVIANLGDSRAYQLRDGALRQITADHSVAEEWVRQGRLTPQEAATHPRRHQLTRTLGVDVYNEPDVFVLDAQPGDRILLCSDGLSNELSDSELAELASPPHDIEEAVGLLVEAANRRGGRDNISVVLIEFLEPVAAPPPDEAAAGAVAPAPTPPRRVGRVRQQPRFTWRTAVFLVGLAGVLVGAYYVLDWYANSNYYLTANHQGDIEIYQGQPGGFLWFQPTYVVTTPYNVSELLPSDQSEIVNSISEPSFAAAWTDVGALVRDGQTTTSTSTTTTTLAKAH